MPDSWKKVQLCLYPKCNIFVSYWSDVTNSSELRNHIIQNRFPQLENVVCAMIDANLIVDMAQLEGALTQALNNYANHKEGTMATRNLTTEIFYCLSPTRSIQQALTAFGVSSSTTRLIAVVVCFNLDQESILSDYLASLTKMIQGKMCSDFNPPENINTILDYYGITMAEQKLITKSVSKHEILLESILTRMVAKSLCRS